MPQGSLVAIDIRKKIDVFHGTLLNLPKGETGRDVPQAASANIALHGYSSKRIAQLAF